MRRRGNKRHMVFGGRELFESGNGVSEEVMGGANA